MIDDGFSETSSKSIYNSLNWQKLKRLSKINQIISAQVSSANEKPSEPELCSPMSERTTTLMDSGVESSNSENINK